jgi:DNA-binding transcriptional ArsR family regulator
MIVFRFTHEDLLRTRFAIGPLCELMWSVAVLREPEAHGIHLPWVRAARRRLDGLPLDLLHALGSRGPSGYVPDFPAPPPTSPLPDLAGELARVRATPPAQVRRELGWRFGGTVVPDCVRPLLDDPGRGLLALTELMAAYWERAIAPWWPAIRTALEDDVRHRAARLTASGTGEVFAGLHPQVRWAGGALVVDRPAEQEVELSGRGLLLVPACFAWPDVFAMTDAPWQPALIYAPVGIGELWAPSPPPDPGALAALLGARRAAVLVALARPQGTGSLAAALALPASSISEHVGILRRAGLVRSVRDGRAVTHERTPAGDAVALGGA